MKSYYSKKVIEHFLGPKNFGRIKDADGMGDTANLRCGDVMKLYIKVKKGIIADAKFETLGCAAALATSDIICELAKGKTPKEALKLDYAIIEKELGYLPPVKKHCAHLAQVALKAAIEDYEKKQERK